MPVIIYPPSLPLYDAEIHHRQETEKYWACPIPYLPFLFFTTVIFLVGLWGASHLAALPMLAFAGTYAHLLASLLPPLVLVVTILITPQMSSPAWGYFNAMSLDPFGRHLRWNLAVVATAHIYCGNLAQSEWLSQMSVMSVDDRLLAFSFIRRVRSRLQQIPVIYASDMTAALIACGCVIAVCIGIFHLQAFEAFFHGFALIIVVQLFMLYLFSQRWQHVRRLMELEDIFDELLPSSARAPRPPEEDEVTRWAREREEAYQAKKSGRAPVQYPPAPWE